MPLFYSFALNAFGGRGGGSFYVFQTEQEIKEVWTWSQPLNFSKLIEQWRVFLRGIDAIPVEVKIFLPPC